MPGFFTSFKNDEQECNTIEKCNSPLPSFLSSGQNRNVNKRKNNMTLSEESGIGYRKTHLISLISARFLPLLLVGVWRFTHFYCGAFLLEKQFCQHFVRECQAGI